MVTYQLTTAQTAEWSDAKWRAGFLAALTLTIPPDVNWCIIASDTGTELAKYQRVWQAA